MTSKDSRKLPKRLFSFDNLKPTRRSSSESSTDPYRHGRAQSKPSLADVQEIQAVERDPWEELAHGGRVTSPVEDPFASRPGTPMAYFPPKLEQSVSLPARSDTPDSYRSASPSRRWDQLRQHVIPPSPTRPATPPARPPSAASSRHQGTGKSSRLAKIAFRQVVDHAKEAHENRKFGEEIARVCFTLRFPPNDKSDNSSLIAGGSTIALPFMSNTTLTSTMHNTGVTKKSDSSKRPQSTLSFPSAPKNASLKSLFQLLLYHSSPSPDNIGPTYLPNEGQVLSTLLVPFLASNRSTNVEEERTIAIETFELLSKGWIARDDAERCVWCCKAMLIPSSPARTRILGTLWNLLGPGERNRTTVSIHGYLTICHHLLMVLAFLHSTSSGAFNEGETRLVKELIDKVVTGSYGDISEADGEQEYGVVWLAEDTRDLIRKAVFLEALARCLENCSQSTRAWLLLNVVEEYWLAPSQDQSWSALQMAIHSRKLNTFCRAASHLLYEEGLEPGEKLAIAQQIVTLTRSRVIRETQLLDQTTSLDSRLHISKLLLELLCLDNAKEVVRWATNTLSRWLHEEDQQWKMSLEKTINHAITEYPWSTVVQLLGQIVNQLPDQDRKPIVAKALPALCDRLINDAPPFPNVELSNLLNSWSRLYPLIFFKPLFLCAASSKELTVVNHLCTLVVLSKFVEDFWWRDAEMISIALLGDIPGSSNENSDQVTMGGRIPWGVARLGQSVLMVELINQLQTLRRRPDKSSGQSDRSLAAIGKFLQSLETRLTILLEAKEQTAQFPPSLRLLFCMLFREFRLLTKSLKPAPWLHRTVSWFSTFFDEDDLTIDVEQEVADTMDLIHTLFLSARDSSHQNRNRRSSIVMSKGRHDPSKGDVDPTLLDVTALFEERRSLIDGLLKGFPSKAMKLFVAVSPLFSDEEYNFLGSILWDNCLTGSADSALTAPACFLLMQCAEKATMNFLAIVEVDLRSSDERTRLEGVRKIGILTNWRFQIMSQQFISDRTHRPFKMARIPLPFVAMDMGTTLYVPSEDTRESKENEIPPELRKQLAELGWAEENSGPSDPLQERRKAPMSLLPVTQLEKMDLTSNAGGLDNTLGPTAGSANSPMASPNPSPGIIPTRRGKQQLKEPEDNQASLLRRSSTSGGPTSNQKRRAIFVPPLTGVFIRLSKLIYDPNFLVAAATRAILFDLMRNDPPLLTRPVMDLFAGDHKDIATAVTTFSTYLHAHQVLPPPMSHNIFNNIMGFLKYSSRQLDVHETLHDYALVLPVLANVITQVNGMSMREIRRSKTDPLVVPSGALWFAENAPKGPMFPRGQKEFDDPFEDVGAKILSTTIVRISQNLLFLAMLKRNPQEVTLIRKNASRLVLPSLSRETLRAKPLDLKDMLPQLGNPINPPTTTIEIFSLVFARSHLMLVAQVFRSMSRHLSDRNELALWIDGINKILCRHGHDIGIVGHALIALMVATTRFRRLFTSGTAYTLFMPVLIKIYAESETHPGIRPAIEYAVNRFYALHAESFLYQTLGVLGQVAMLPTLEETSFAKSVYSLFFSLTKEGSSFTVDAAGIHNINKSQEREALIVNTAEEKPQTFLASIRRVDSQTTTQLTTTFPEEYEAERLRMDNFVRLFLTVIAHDLTIMRAQHYLRLFRVLTPPLFNCAGLTRSVLVEGVTALSSILLKGPKSKLMDATASRITGDEYTLLSTYSNMEQHSSEQANVQSDLKMMRIDYLHLVLCFRRSGGEVSLKVARQVLEILKIILKDSTTKDASNKVISKFLFDFVEAVLLQDQAQEPKYVIAFLQDLAPLLHAYNGAIDMTGVFNSVYRLTLLPVYSNDRLFSQVVVGEICTAGLTACELAASENNLESLPSRPTLIKLIAECVFLEGADIVAEIEKRTASFGFLAGVVLPLAMELKTEAQINADGLRTQERHHSVLAGAWLRILSYIISACQRSAKTDSAPTRTKTKDKNSRQDAVLLRSKLSVLAIGLQILKIIVVRAEVNISSTIPGIWERVAAFLKTMLSDGSADFAIRHEAPSNFNSAFNSAVNSPTASPRVSAQFDPSPSNGWGHLSASQLSSGSGLRLSLHDHSYSRPRVIDYMLWSTLEFLWAYRSPLRLQLRLLTTEKIIALDHELRKMQRNSMSSPRKRRVSSIFSKVRSRTSAFVPSPDASPLLSAMNSGSLLEPSPAFLDVRRPGYQISPISPSERRTLGGPQILHLGPASPSAFQEPPSPGLAAGGGMRNVIRSVKIKSFKLSEATYRRIRGVQALMGYDLLLPLPGGIQELEEDTTVLKTWTLSQALAAIRIETKDLLDEFEQGGSVDYEEDVNDAASIAIEIQPEISVISPI